MRRKKTWSSAVVFARTSSANGLMLEQLSIRPSTRSENVKKKNAVSQAKMSPAPQRRLRAAESVQTATVMRHPTRATETNGCDAKLVRTA